MMKFLSYFLGGGGQHQQKSPEEILEKRSNVLKLLKRKGVPMLASGLTILSLAFRWHFRKLKERK
jgi:hypothetical protein